MRSIDFLRSEFNIFNYYLSLTDPEPIRKIKTLEFAKKERAVWNDTCDIVLNQLKIKYTPEDVTDDDHALNAAHNL